MAVLEACRRANLPLTFRAAGTSLSGQAISDSVLVQLCTAWNGIEIEPGGALVSVDPAVIGGRLNRALAPLRAEAGSGSGLHQLRDDRRHRGQQRQRDVLRHGAEQLSHAPLDARRAGRRRSPRHRERGKPQRVPRIARVNCLRRLSGTGRARLWQPGAGRADSAQVPDEEHHRLQPERAGGFHGPDRYPAAPDDRLGRHARFHEPDHVPDRAGAARQGQRAAVLSRRAHGLRGDGAAEEMPGQRGRDHGPRQPALGGGEARNAGLPRRAWRGGDGTAGRDGRRNARRASDADRDFDARRWPAVPLVAPDPVHGGRRRSRAALERAQGAIPVRRRRAGHRHHGHHRRRSVPDRAPGRRRDRSSGSSSASTATTRPSSSATRSRATSTSFSRRTSGPSARWRATTASSGTSRELVVGVYDGSLKAEHGTGRNMAPFVEREWGAEAYGLMREIKDYLRSRGHPQSGRDPQRRPRSAPEEPEAAAAADPLVDRCIECGFCEINCPSRDLTLTPRQRIVSWREISRLERDGGDAARLAELKRAIRIPGQRDVRGGRAVRDELPGLDRHRQADQGAAAARELAGREARREWVAGHMGAVTAGMRVMLSVVDAAHACLGTAAHGRAGRGGAES